MVAIVVLDPSQSAETDECHGDEPCRRSP